MRASFSDHAPTRRQVEVLACVASGDDTGEIAGRMDVSKPRVREMLKRTCVLLGARSAPHAVLLAVGAGWLEVEDERVAASDRPFRPVQEPWSLTAKQRLFLEAFDRLLKSDHRPDAGDQMLDEVGAVVAFTDQYGFVPEQRSQ